MRKVMIVFGLLTVLTSSMITGCSKSEREKKKDLVGTYINRDDSSEYFILEEDGIYRYHHEKLGYDLTGKWETKDNKLIVSYPATGPMPPSTIKGNKIISGDGSFYIKAKVKSPAFLKPASIVSGKEITKKKGDPKKKISEDTIKMSGEYIVEEIKKDGTTEKAPGVTIFKEDGIMVLRSSGSEFIVPKIKWRFKNGVVQLCPDDGSKPLEGKVEGNTIIFKMKDGNLRYTKQD